jgi:hypothetical protein
MLDSNPQMNQVSELLLQGQSNKVPAPAAIPFLRAAMNAIAKPGSRQTMAVIRQESGIEWIIPPPPETRKSIPQTASQPGQSERADDAPSLLHPPSR